jgi:copper chaperone
MFAATLGVLVVSGGLSLCDLCDTNRASQRGATHELVSVAEARMPGGLGSVAEKASMTSLPSAAAKTVTFKIQGMTCGGCVFAVRKVLTRLPGVSKADVTYEDSRATVSYDPKLVTVGQMTAAIKTLGYDATVIAPKASR